MRTRSIVTTSMACVLILAATGCSCGDGDLPDADAGPTDGGVTPMDTGPLPDGFVPMRCGNSMMEGAETCDDGNTDAGDGCSATCQLECGDGMVGADELCDPGIAAGETGACPTDCDDADACTTDALSGDGCSVECVHGDITAVMDGDGCCPTGADSTTDDDCTATCGNSVVETGETCDSAIAAGEAGACPTTCDDGISCTTDAMTGAACTAACTNVEITAAMDGDGCCPAGATPATDDDCAGCGDGTVVAPETCDTGIATGAGSCPTAATCNDGDACTADSLVAGGTCMAACANTAIAAGPADSCCPSGATIGTDPDCAASCGDGVVTAPEQCDPPAAGTCSATCQTIVSATAFRFTDLDLRDPHIYVDAFGCRDLTNSGFLTVDSINQQIQDAIRMDSDSPADGLDLSIALVFRPLDQAAATNPLEVVFPDCPAPYMTTMCTLPATETPIESTATNMTSGTCLAPLPMTTRGAYTPAITNTTGPCFNSDEETIIVTIADIDVPLRQARVAAQYVGSPATGLVQGLIRGFLTEADGNMLTLPADLPLVGGDPLSSVLPGGTGCCASHTDIDILADGTRGWWFYLNFTAARVPYTEL
jgi:cysteine-rich repeat protein